MGTRVPHGAERKTRQQAEFLSIEVECTLLQEGNGSQAEKGEGSRNHRRKQARVRKSHGEMQQFRVDVEVKEQRQRKQSAVRREDKQKVCRKRQRHSKVKN